MKLVENIAVSPVVTAKALYEELKRDAALLNGTQGRAVQLKIVKSGRTTLYITVEKTNVGLVTDISQIGEIEPIVQSGFYKAYCTGVDGNKLLISVEESEEANVAQEEKKSSQDAETRLRNLLSEEEVNIRLTYMETFGLTADTNPRLYHTFLNKICDGIESRQQAGKPLPPKPSVLFVTANKTEELNPMLSLARSWVAGNPLALEGQMGLGKDVAFESFAWNTVSDLLTYQWGPKSTRGDFFAHQATDNSVKDSLTEEGIASFFEYIRASIKSCLFKKEAKKELETGLNIVKAMSPALKMVPGPFLEALNLANEGIPVILVNDEMNLGDPATVAQALNYLIDGHTPNIYVAGVGVVPINRDRLYIGATFNGVGGDYIGTKKMNTATMSRFGVDKMTAPGSILSILRTNGFEVDEETYSILDDIYKEYSKGVADRTYPPSSLNIRGLKRCITEVYYGCSVRGAVALCVNNALQSDDDTDMLNTVVDTLIPTV